MTLSEIDSQKALKPYRIFMAPMLGITDVSFRNVFAKHFPGFDDSYAPFIRVNQNSDFKQSKMAELSPSLNGEIPVIPQIMCNQAEPFLHVISILSDLGYTKVNLNLGCPSPTSSGRNLGCGLMPETDRIDRLLEQVCAKSPLKVSIKTRLGLSSSADILNLAPVFNRYPLDHVVIHPRTGQQGYSGEVDLLGFEAAREKLKSPVYYSGDIKTPEDLVKLKLRFSEISDFLIGRGALRNPKIVESIRRGVSVAPTASEYDSFLEELSSLYFEKDLSLHDVLFRIKTLCFYFANGQSFPPKQVKAIRKARNMAEIQTVLRG